MLDAVVMWSQHSSALRRSLFLSMLTKDKKETQKQVDAELVGMSQEEISAVHQGL
jgi:hypothetical protein